MKSTKYHGTIKGKIDTNVQKPVVFVNLYHISLKVFSDKKKRIKFTYIFSPLHKYIHVIITFEKIFLDLPQRK